MAPDAIGERSMPVVHTIQPQSNKFVTGLEIKTAGSKQFSYYASD